VEEKGKPLGRPTYWKGLRRSKDLGEGSKGGEGLKTFPPEEGRRLTRKIAPTGRKKGLVTNGRRSALIKGRSFCREGKGGKSSSRRL